MHNTIEYLGYLILSVRREGEEVEPNERLVGFANGHFVLLGGEVTEVLKAGDVVEVCLQGRYQPVCVASGGYKGWYYVTEAGRKERFGLCMRARVIGERG